MCRNYIMSGKVVPRKPKKKPQIIQFDGRAGAEGQQLQFCGIPGWMERLHQIKHPMVSVFPAGVPREFNMGSEVGLIRTRRLDLPGLPSTLEEFQADERHPKRKRDPAVERCADASPNRLSGSRGAAPTVRRAVERVISKWR